jgi:hypothetical protein
MTNNKNLKQQQPFLLKPGNVGLARLLFALAKAGPDGLPTRKLLEALHSTNHGQDAIKRAEKEGYIKRIRDVKPVGSGNHLVVNKLTSKGHQLLDKLAK